MNKNSLWGTVLPRKLPTLYLIRVMKITLVMAFVCVFSLYAADGHSQNELVTLTKNNCPLGTILNEIEEQTDYLFVVNSNVNTKQIVSVKVKNSPIWKVLQRVLADTNIGYSIEGTHIILSTNIKANSKMIIERDITQQSRVITGKVLDESGEEMIGAGIKLKGTPVGTITDINGNFSLSHANLSDNSILEFSFVGYKTEEIRIGAQKHVVVTLKTDNKVLDEIVVVGYGTQKKANLTGAVSTVNVKEQLSSRSIPDIARGLQGSAPGLTVRTNNGAIGTDASIKVRGIIGSANGNSSPLVLVDNAEVTSLSVINPDDVESISVLKDAASASIYGARAAFGVVLIATKKAKEGEKFSINYSNNLSWRKPTVTPTIVKSYEGAEMSWKVGERINPNLSEQTNSCFLSWNLESIERMKEWNRVYGGMNLGQEMVLGRDFEIIDNKMFFYRSFDAPGEYIKNDAFQQTHNLSVNGTVSKTAYNFSLGYLGEDGVIKVNTDKFERYSVTFGTSTVVNPYVDVRSKLIFSKTILETPYSFGPSSSYDSWYYLYRWPRIMPYGTYQGKPFRNAVTETQQANMNNRTNNYTRISIGATGKILPGLTVDVDYVYTRTDRLHKNNGGEVSGWNFWGGSGLVDGVWTTSTHNRVQQSTDQSDFHVGNIVLRFNKDVKEHRFNAIAGMNIEYYTNTGITAERRDLIDASKPEFSLATGDQFASGYHGQWAVLGYFGRINYAYKGRYLLELNGRFDGSSRFPLDKLWGFFPSVSGGWIMSEESFLKSLKPWLSTLKIKASWGEIGNQDVGENAFLPILESTSSGWVRGENIEKTFGLPRTISKGFSWEVVTTTNLGIDARFLNNKLGVSLDYFTRVTSDMITSGEALPSTFGASAPKVNFGELTTRGWELAVDFRHRLNNGLRINTTAYVSDATAEYTKYRSASRLITGIYEGRKYGEIWGFETDRFFTADDFITDPNGKLVLKEGIPSQSYFETNNWFFYGPGDIKYKNLDGNKVIDKGDNTVDNPGDQRIIGNSTPRYEYGFRLGLDWKGIDLGVFIQGVGKRQLWSSGSIVIPGFNYLEAWYTHQTDYWTEENPNAFYPRLSNTGQSNNTQNFLPQTKYLLNMAYCRLKNVSVGYTLPQKWLRPAGLKNLRVYMNFENLFEIDHLGNIPIDPETNTQTGDGDYIGRSYPYCRTASFGVQLTF